jgi:hypothetical protein
MWFDAEEYDSVGGQGDSEAVDTAESESLSQGVWDEIKGAAAEVVTTVKEEFGSVAEPEVLEVKDEGLYSSVFDRTSAATDSQPKSSDKRIVSGNQAEGATTSAANQEMRESCPQGKPLDTSKNKSAADQSGHSKPESAAQSKPVDRKEMEKAADAIEQACNGGLIGAGTDKETIYNILKDKTQAEREVIDQIFREKYGKKYGKAGDGSDWGLKEEFEDEMSGADLDKAMNLLNRKDGDADDAGRIHTALIEKDQWFEGRSKANCEKDIRDTLSTMNSEQIAQLDAEYVARYGKHLREALMDDPKLSAATKQCIDIYLKGSDKITREDTLQLADIALKEKNMDMFQEAFRHASPEARKAFADQGGEQKMKEAFEGHWYNALPWLVSPALGMMAGPVTDGDLQHAKDYVQGGHLSTATKIRDNTSVIGDNEKAIEKALKDMTPEERKEYLRGRELSDRKTDESALSEADKKALKTYRDIHGALESAGHKAEIARWEDMIAVKDGGLVAKLASHAPNTAGHLWTDSRGDVLKDIENMSRTDWEYAKKHPEYREEVRKALEELKGVRISQADADRALKMYDEKMAVDKYEDSTGKGRRMLTEALEDDTHWYGNDRKSMVDSIAHMTPDEQKKYRENTDGFREKVDRAVKESLGDTPAGEAAQRMLDRVKEGRALESDIVTELLVRAQEQKDLDEKVLLGATVAGGAFGFIQAATDVYVSDGVGRDALIGSRSAGVVKDLQEAFEKDPKLRERLMAKPPLTPEDEQLQKDFQIAIHKAVSDVDYRKYIQPLLETGHLPIEKQMELKKALFDDDEQAAYKDLVALAKDKSPEAQKEKDKILNDKEYQDKVLGFLSDDERAIALNALKQGEMRPEDVLRSYMVGAGTGEEEVKAQLAKLSPEGRETVRREYARKYNTDLTADLIDELGGQDKKDALRLIQREPASAREAYNRERDGYYQSYDGAGKAFVDKVWDGTGHMSADAMNEFSAKVTEFSSRFKELPPEQQKELTEKLRTALDQFVASKGAAADAVVDAAIAVVAVAGAFFTDGISLGLLAATGFGAALFKVACKSILMGSDYDWGSQAGIDAVTGFVDGFLAFLGPGEAGALLGIGKSGAQVAERAVLAALKREAGELAAREIIKGGEEALQKAMQKAVRDAMVNGSYKVSDKAIDKLVAELAKEGATEAEKAVLKRALQAGTADGLKAVSEGMSKTQKLALEYGLNMAGGALGGGGSGALRGFAEWDENKSFADNLARVGKTAALSAAFGAAGAAGFTTLFKVGGSMYHSIREHFNLKPGEKLSGPQLKELENAIKKEAGEGAKVTVTQDTNGDLNVKVEGARLAAHRPVPDSGLPRSGEVVSVDGKSFQVIGRDGRHVVVRPADAQPPHWKGHEGTRVSTEELSSKYKKVSDSEYYVAKDGDGSVYYSAVDDGKGGKVLVQDWDAQAVKPSKITARNGQDRLPPTLPPEVWDHPSLNYAEIPPEQRAVMLERARRNEMYMPEVMDGFVSKAADTTAKWKDLSDLSTRAQTSKTELDRAWDRYYREVQEKLVDRLKNPDGTVDPEVFKRLSKTDEVRKLVGDDQEMLKALNDYVKARDLHAESQRALKAGMDERTAQVQELMNKFTDERGLPRVKVDLADPAFLNNAHGGYVDGKLHLNRDLVVGNKEPAALIETMYHELVHAEQDSLVIRALAEEVGAGHPPTSEQLAQLQQKYKQETGIDVSKEHLEETLRAAKDKPPLTDDEMARASYLIEDWASRPLSDPAYVKAGQDLSVVNSELSKLTAHPPLPTASLNLVEKLSQDNGTLCRHLFGTDTPPADVARLIDAYRRMQAGQRLTWPGEAANSILAQHLQGRATGLEAFRKDVYARYLSAAHEQEAFIIGRKAKLEAERKGALGQPIEPEVIRELDTGMVSGDIRRKTLPGVGDERPPATKRGLGDTSPVQPPATKRGLGDLSPDQPPVTKRGLGDLSPDQPPVTKGGPGDLSPDQPPATKRGLGDQQSEKAPAPKRGFADLTQDQPPPTLPSADHEHPRTVRYDEPTTVRYDEPATVRYDEPTTVTFDKPVVVTYDTPDGPVSVLYDEPTTIRFDEPVTVRFDEPTTVRYDGPTTVRYDGPATVR